MVKACNCGNKKLTVPASRCMMICVFLWQPLLCGEDLEEVHKTRADIIDLGGCDVLHSPFGMTVTKVGNASQGTRRCQHQKTMTFLAQ